MGTSSTQASNGSPAPTGSHGRIDMAGPQADWAEAAFERVFLAARRRGSLVV